jgi:branched-chain amino acid transport system ATP-binding protein
VSTVIDAAGLSVGYGGSPVVRDLDLHVDEGEVVALLGANGAGKTTTLLGLSALAARTGGEVRVLGRATTGMPAHQIAARGVAHVPEDRALFTDLTVRENLQLGFRSRRADVSAAFRYFPALEPLLGRRAGLLSGGEQQMLAVGRALASRPRVLMVDEMSLGLAPIIVQRLLPVLRQVAEETGCGILLVEQHVHLALDIADRAYVLSRGRLTMEGPAASLATDAHLLEASYLGDSFRA